MHKLFPFYGHKCVGSLCFKSSLYLTNFKFFFLTSEIDYINCTPPCAGLSMLSTSKTRGSQSKINSWIVESSRYCLSTQKPKVLWGENAPGLFTAMGEGVVNKLRLAIQAFSCHPWTLKPNCFKKQSSSSFLNI